MEKALYTFLVHFVFRVLEELNKILGHFVLFQGVGKHFDKLLGIPFYSGVEPLRETGAVNKSPAFRFFEMVMEHKSSGMPFCSRG